MVQDAEANAEADKERRESVEIRNNADALVHSTEKNLTDYGDKISEDDKSAIETGIEELKEALEGEDFEIIKTRSDALSEVSMKLGEAMYKAAQSENLADGMSGADMGSGINPEEASSENSDNVVDADFEEVDPDAEAKGKKDD